MEIASRFSEGRDSKCPVCRVTGTSFAKVEGGLLSCLKCGCVFMSRAERDRYAESLPKLVQEQRERVKGEIESACKEGSTTLSRLCARFGMAEGYMSGLLREAGYTHTCDVCGQPCKGHLGLSSHKRHNHTKVIETVEEGTNEA